MSEELQSLVQIIELYGRGLEGLGKAIRFSAKGAEKGVQIAQVKALQHRMKLHYASEGTHNTMKLSDLEKMTGGRYTILNIPLEDEKELISFYDRLKKLKVSFSELPDLNLGDGYTQIAYNPDDVESVRLVIDYYKKKFRQEAKEMDLDEYFGTASPGGLEYLNELAAKGYEGRMHEEQLEEIQERIRDKEYLPISINVESLLLREEKDAYLFRIPRGRLGEDLSSAIRIKKSDCILLDEGQTVITCLKREGELWGYALDQRKNINEKEKVKLDITKLEKAFAQVGDDRVKMIGKLKPEYAAIFPSFHEGQEIPEKSSVPDLVPEKTVEKVLSLEKMKERYQSPEYIPVPFDRRRKNRLSRKKLSCYLPMNGKYSKIHKSRSSTKKRFGRCRKSEKENAALTVLANRTHCRECCFAEIADIGYIYADNVIRTKKIILCVRFIERSASISARHTS